MRITLVARTALVAALATAGLGVASVGVAGAEGSPAAPSYGPHLSDLQPTYGPIAPRRSAQATLMSPVSTDDLGRKFR